MTRNAIAALAIGALLLVVGACGGNDGDGGFDEENAALVLDPPTSEHLIVGGAAPPTQAFTARLVDPDGNTRDVTADVAFSIDASFGAFSGTTLSITAAGKTLAYGTYENKVGTAEVISRAKITRVEDGLPTNTPDIFDNGTEDPARAPVMAYPADGVIVPRNLGDFELHWTDPSGNDVFEVSLKTEYADVRVYTAGNNGVAAAGPRPSWLLFQSAEWLTAVGIEGSVTYQVRGANTANPGPIGATAKRVVQLSNELMQGGVYYWATKGGAFGIYRHDMSKPGERAEEFMTTNQTAGRCVACHALSRDGRKMAITYDGGNQPGTVIDVASATRAPEISNWNFSTYSADAMKLLTVIGGTLTVRDADTMQPLVTMPSDGFVSHPDVSADGTRLVYVRTAATDDIYFTTGQIFTRSFDPVTNAFGAETPLVVGNNNFYPSWSPDGQWVLFNSSPAGEDAYDNPNASLWVIKADGNPANQPIALAAANQAAGGLTNSWGRWAPFQQTVGPDKAPIYWITTSSKRDFGVRRINSIEASEPAKSPQIWMTPFFTGRAEANQDPSVPAFRLPFQLLETNNHIAQWAERVVVTQ